ncbi:hypothetical protein Godav_023848 [Gossypium davidsonii]|uniref:Zinc-ribbon domain-containing protein n=2 Tax=Gossypium TaxID=3633 RepID=A0A7J8ST25_GOSDV|nr:hypothetical protein [Gossypium davidsonii]MBA0664941.1 hypothetical protein [Gossypium klotzschianum]
MATETAPKVRYVRCPKCLLVLREVADIPIYKCGGCDAILVAKNKKAIAKTTSVLQEAEAVGNQLVRLSERGESSGSGLQDVVPSPLESRLSQESGENRDVSTGSHSEEHGEDVSLEARYEKDQNTSRDSDGNGEMLDENRSTGSHSEEQDQHLLVEGRRNGCYEKEQNASRDSDGDMLDENRSTDSRSKKHGENSSIEGQRNGRYEKDQDTSRDGDGDGDMVDESRSIDSHSEEHGENLSVEGHNGSYEADQIASRDGDGDMVDENGPNEGQQNGTGLLQTESLEHCDVRLPGVSIEGSISAELHHENEELVLEAETNLEAEANVMSLQLEGGNSQLETNDKVDSNTGGSPKGEHHRFNSVRSMDTYGTVDFVSIGSEFSGPIEYLSKSTTIRSSHAYDGSISSYDGMDDHFPDQQLHSFENNYKPANLSSDFSNKKHYAMRRYGKWHRDEPLEPVTHHRPLRNWPRLERDQYPSQIPLSQRVPLNGYESAGPSHESRDELPFDSAFHPFKKAEYGKEEKMKLLKMVYELQDQISKTCQLNEKTNGNASSDVPWKQEHFSTYNHQKEPPEDEILYPTYYGRHGPRNSWSQRSRFSHVPFSGGAINTRHGIDNTCLCCHPQAWQHSEQLPPPVFPHNRGFCRACRGHNCYNSFSSCPSSPQRHLGSDFSNWIHESQSDDQRYRDHEMKRYLREKHHSARRHIRPTAGGAPFLTCYYCITPLQLPADFLLFKRRFHQLRCGACSKVLKLSLQEGTHIVPYDLVAEAPPPSEVEDHSEAINVGISGLASSSHGNLQADPMSYSDDYGHSFCISCSTDGDPVSHTKFHHLQGSNADFKNMSSRSSKAGPSRSKRGSSEIEGLPPKPGGSPLHRLMGYSSLSQVLRGIGPSFSSKRTQD